MTGDDAAQEDRGEDRAEAGEAGFVLLSVLLAVALFMAAAASFAVKSKLAAMQAGNRLEQARARALTDGAVLFAVDALTAAQAAAPPPRAPATAPAPSRAPTSADTASTAPAKAQAKAPVLPFASDGTPLSCSFSDGRTMEIAVIDQGGLLDLNVASPEMMVDLLRETGLDGERALQMASGIVDFRDENDLPEAGGASEAALYREAGKPWGPRNGGFLAAAEIAQLPAFPPDLLVRLQPLFTVYNTQVGVDFAVMDRRARALFPKEIKGLEPLERWLLASPRRAFSVEAALRRDDGTVSAARHGLVTFGETTPETATDGAGKPHPPRIVEWREMLMPPRDPSPVAAAAASPFCRNLRRALEDGRPGPS